MSTRQGKGIPGNINVERHCLLVRVHGDGGSRVIVEVTTRPTNITVVFTR